ncbi:MAG: CoA-binding protein [Dehalococcoidia bacterium]|nr:MAG: CoA-binding protein [Dehalococcoidia bacterium]
MKDQQKEINMTRDGGFGQGFPPRTIAIVGVSRNEHMNVPGYTGARLFRILRESGFKGRIYPVNPKADTIDGIRVYPNVTSIPEPLDLVTIGVPAAVVPHVLEDCAAIGALNVQVLTSGFGETGETEGKTLESSIREIAQREGLRIIGPNCMGFQIPSINMKMFEEVELVPGPVAFVSQSGGHARIYLLQGPRLGIGFSKVISYGNALILDAPDFLEYLATDPETRIICMYLEGIKDGRRLAQLVRQINPSKPVVIWKGGLTSSGARAASSHTGSLAGELRIWDAFFKQTGAIAVDSIDEMAEVTMALIRLKSSAGKRVAVIGAGGGDSVATGDIVANEGLHMPAISPQTRKRLLDYLSLVNQGVSNPLDIPMVFGDISTLRRTLELLAADPLIDMTILHVNAEFFPQVWGHRMAEFTGCILDVSENNAALKPIVLAVTDEGKVASPDKYVKELIDAGIPAYNSLNRACRAIRRFADYHQFVADVGLQKSGKSRGS